MLPTGIHIALADTSAPPRALLTTIAAINAKLIAAWRGAAWRHCSPLAGQRFAGTIPNSDWTITSPLSSSADFLPGEILLEPDGNVFNTLPLYVGDRLLATNIRLSSSSSLESVITTKVIRYGAGAPGSDEALLDLPDAETLAEVTTTLPRRIGGTPRPVDVLLDLTTILGAPVPIRDWDMLRVVTTAVSGAPILFHALSELVDHPL